MRLIRDLGYFLIFCLMLLGIGGTMYHAMGREGWLDRVLGNIFHHGLGSVLVAIVGGGLVFWYVRRMTVARRSNHAFNDLWMYGVIALGLVFAGRLVMLGHL